MIPTPLGSPVATGIITTTATITPVPGQVIGTVSIDQTTPGDTNGVEVNAALPAGANIIGKVGIDPAVNNVDVDTLPATAQVKQGALTDRSGSIAVGGTAQQMMAVNVNRRYLLIVNDDLAETMWINFTTTAVEDEPSIPILAQSYFFMENGFISTEAISVIAATAGHKWTAKEG